MKCLCQVLHEVFCFWICLGSQWSYFSVIDSILLHVPFYLLTSEWWSIVTFYCAWYSTSKEILSIFRMMVLADDEWAIYTSGNCKYASITTKRYLPIVNEPQKSMGGNGDICRGSGWLPQLFAWQALHLSKFCLTLLSIPENQIFSQSNCFVLLDLDDLHELLRLFSLKAFWVSQCRHHEE